VGPDCQQVGIECRYNYRNYFSILCVNAFVIFSLRMHLESFEHEQNIPASHKNVPEYLECTRCSVRSFRMHFDCQRMYFEFSFRRHSGSFRHSCDEGITMRDRCRTLLIIITVFTVVLNNYERCALFELIKLIK